MERRVRPAPLLRGEVSAAEVAPRGCGLELRGTPHIPGPVPVPVPGRAGEGRRGLSLSGASSGIPRPRIPGGGAVDPIDPMERTEVASLPGECLTLPQSGAYRYSVGGKRTQTWPFARTLGTPDFGVSPTPGGLQCTTHPRRAFGAKVEVWECVRVMRAGLGQETHPRLFRGEGAETVALQSPHTPVKGGRLFRR